MKKILRYSLRGLIGIIGLIIIVWAIAFAYMMFNKASIIAKVRDQINKQIKGTVVIGDITTNFIRTFPNISVSLSNVNIKDSLWHQHRHDFLNAGKIFTRIQLFSLFSGKPKISKVIVENAVIYLYTDSTGYTNLVRADNPATPKGNPDIPDLLFLKTRFVMENKDRNKLHDIEASRLACDVDQKKGAEVLNINLRSVVHSLAFNTLKGTYLKGKSLEGKFQLVMIPKKEIRLNNVKLKVDKQPFTLNGRFLIGATQPSFTLSIQTREINYNKAASLLTNTLQQKLDTFNIIKPFDLSASITGLMAYRSIPLVTVNFGVNNSDVQTPAGTFTKCSFSGGFTNQVSPAQARIDENSKFTIKDFQGKWEQIPLNSNSIEIFNLKKPFLTCDLRSQFALRELNELTGSTTMQFKKGTGNVDIRYKGSIISNDTIVPTINGNIRLTDAEINYVPRNFSLLNCDGNLEFKNQDLFIRHLNATAGNSRLNMNGSVKNLLALININPEQLTLEWNVSTHSLNLNDFIGYLAKRSGSSAKISSGKRTFTKTADKIDRMLKDGIARLNIRAGKVTYKKFIATNVAASVSLLQNQILLNNVQVNHAGGSLYLKGSLADGNRANALKLNTRLNNIDIPDLFHSFNNFGQDAITEHNMKGKLSADVNVTGLISDKAMVVQNSLAGTVNFSVKDGQLINFEPIAKISETAFKKRDFTNVRFAELKNKLDIKGSAIKVNPMEIRSSVFTMFVEGVYDTKRGTDMRIQIPLSNLKKPDQDAVLKNRGKMGAMVRLWAKTGDDGQLKVSWDPFNKAGQEDKVVIAKRETDTTTVSKKDTRSRLQRLLNKKKDR